MNTMPRPEHPLPQWERSTWKNLNGEWDFSFDFGKSGVDRCFYEKKDWEKKIIVPFCPESDLSGIGYKDYMDAVWYHKTVELTEVEVKGRVLLHFGAVDYDARVWINGTEVGRHKGGYTSFTFDITAYVQAGANDIAVYAEDDLRSGKQPHGKQSGLYYSHGCEYTRTTGIWQTVWLEFVPENYVKKARFFPNVEAGTITIEAVTVGDGSFCAEAGCGLSSGRPVSFSLSVMLSLPAFYSWKLYHESKSMSIFLNVKAAPPKRDGFSGSDRHGEPQLFQMRAQRSGARLKAVRLRRRRPARGRAAKCTRPPQCQPAYIRSG